MGETVKICIVVPAFQAAASLPRVIERIPAGTWRNIDRLFVIDDGSTDGTQAAAFALAEQRPCIRVTRLEDNRGYGGAVKRGLALARPRDPDACICLHADGQYAPELIPAMLDELNSSGLDLLQGSRLSSGTALSGGMPVYKYLAGLVLTGLENRVLGLSLSDYHSGYLVYGRRALNEIPFEGLSDRFEFDLEVIVSARARGLKVGERPIPTHYGQEVSHLNPISYGLRVLGVLARYLRGEYSPGGTS